MGNYLAPKGGGQHHDMMEAVDRINDKWGRDTLCYGCTGLRREWRSKRLMKSPAYTTEWKELPVVRA